MLEILILLVTKLCVHFIHPASATEDSGQSDRLWLRVYTQYQVWETEHSKQK